MIRVESPAKINLYLDVGPLRPDGYHPVRTLMARIKLRDTLVIQPAPRPSGVSRLELRFAPGYPQECRREIQGGVHQNLVWRAFGLLRDRYPRARRSEVLLLLTKRIPCGAGLGGASSNAAAALLGLSKYFQLRLSEAQMLKLGAQLGSDVPFFVRAGAHQEPFWWAEGRGEKLRPVRTVWRSKVLVIYPRRGMNTAEAYRALDQLRAKPEMDWIPAFAGMTTWGSSALGGIRLTSSRILPTLLSSLEAGRIPEGFGCNSFEAALLKRFKKLRLLQKAMARLGGRAAVTGSGSCLYVLGRPRQVTQWMGALRRSRIFSGWQYYATAIE